MLWSCEIDKDCWAIGPFFHGGVTVWNQQVRALNLVYYLATAERIRNELKPTPAIPMKKIAVIGGGVSGMTAAVAAANLGNEVWHFEQRTELCHLQAGCETRWVHPHIYDWPSPGSENPYAALPLLTWKAGTAAEVARTLIESYERYEAELNGRLKKMLGATTFVSRGRVSWDNCSNPKLRGGCETFELIIIACGFGIEHGVHSGKVDSYWRNDSLNQARPGIRSEKSELIFISGTGDGGLIDVLRSKIRGYNQATIIKELFGPDEEELVIGLRQIATGRSSDPLFDQFKELSPDLQSKHAHFWKQLNSRLRLDVVLILNGRQRTLRDSLSLKTASMQNSFLTYVLYLMEAFTYVPGELLDHDQHSVTLGAIGSDQMGSVTSSADDTSGNRSAMATKYAVDRVIVRHGTDRNDTLAAIGFESSKVSELVGRQAGVGGESFFKPAWDPGWWTRRTTEGLEVDLKEFLPDASQALAAVFTGSVGQILKSFPGAGAKFRLTLHRMCSFGGDTYYQQMAPYVGRSGGDPARIFSNTVGLVGLASRTGKPLVFVRESDDAWNEAWPAMNAIQPVRMPLVETKSILALPVFGPERHVSLVVYADSQELDFWKPTGGAGAWKTLHNSIRGFVRSCDDMVSHQVLSFENSEFKGIAPKVNAADEKLLARFYGRGLYDLETNIEIPLASENYLHRDCVLNERTPEPLEPMIDSYCGDYVI